MGWLLVNGCSYTQDADEELRDFKLSIPNGMEHKIKSMLFGGFDKSAAHRFAGEA